MRWVMVTGKKFWSLKWCPCESLNWHFSDESFLPFRLGWCSHPSQLLEMLKRTSVPTQTHTPCLDSGSLQDWDITFLKEVKRLAGRRDVL